MTQHSILARVSRLAKAEVTALLKQAEDPERLYEQLVREYTDTVRAAEAAVAAAAVDLRLLEADHQEDVEAARGWGERAREASAKADELRAAQRAGLADRFDHLAKVALGHQLRAERDAWAAEPLIASQRDALALLEAGLGRVRERLAELHAHRDEPAARARRDAAARTRMLDALRGVDLLDPAGELRRFADKVRREEAKALGKQEIAVSSLDTQFERTDTLADPAEIESRLAALKSAG
ncbi:PspA/IM30 family protein [Streptomyces sp. MUM 203J]|uniref:PspA/IM30 family protein n=1 Tax=Streptomyces sp. MUM 203J TaxID=2791990 RepID=UPI001F047196|nr:PspA/IM30 family protein [Streptomyces sp. MUM 203J]MCH0540116.1 PspA/IM30 family protein [Streptomyces sp. MUM 203J]